MTVHRRFNRSRVLRQRSRSRDNYTSRAVTPALVHRWLRIAAVALRFDAIRPRDTARHATIIEIAVPRGTIARVIIDGRVDVSGRRIIRRYGSKA